MQNNTPMKHVATKTTLAAEFSYGLLLYGCSCASLDGVGVRERPVSSFVVANDLGNGRFRLSSYLLGSLLFLQVVERSGVHVVLKFLPKLLS